MKKAFIIYVSKNDADVSWLKELLQKNKIIAKYYFISNNTQSEDCVESEISKNIKQSDVLVVYITPSAKDSDDVNWAIEYAQKHKKRIVGIWSNSEKNYEVPQALDEYSDAIVDWSNNHIIEAINGNDKWINSDGTLRCPRNIKRYTCK